MLKHITNYLESLTSLLGQLSHAQIQDVIDLLACTRASGKKVIVMGNGGSAATASHLACDLGKETLAPGQPRFCVVALTDNMPLFSALANDYGYDRVFSEQLRGLVQEGDVVIGISGSGNSPNVPNGIRAAREAQAITVGLVGFDGGALKDLADLSIHVPSDCMEQVEDVHLILQHLISTCLRQAIDEHDDRTAKLSMDESPVPLSSPVYIWPCEPKPALVEKP
jgi:D-sedoheptulose 7-phosphate isomerase